MSETALDDASLVLDPYLGTDGEQIDPFATSNKVAFGYDRGTPRDVYSAPLPPPPEPVLASPPGHVTPPPPVIIGDAADGGAIAFGGAAAIAFGGSAALAADVAAASSSPTRIASTSPIAFGGSAAIAFSGAEPINPELNLELNPFAPSYKVSPGNGSAAVAAGGGALVGARTADGVAEAKSYVQAIGELQLQVNSQLEARLRRAYGKAAWGGEIVSPMLSPNMMQVRRASPADLLRISSGSAVSPRHRPHPHLHHPTFLTFVPPPPCVWVRSSRALPRPRVWATTTIGVTSGRRASHRLRGATASASIVTRAVTNGSFRCSWGLQDQPRRPWRRLCRRGARTSSSGTRRAGRRCAPSGVSHTRAASAAGPTASGMRRRSTTASRSRCVSTTPNGAGTAPVAAAIIESAANHPVL
jgi:hypothetical protein